MGLFMLSDLRLRSAPFFAELADQARELFHPGVERLIDVPLLFIDRLLRRCYQGRYIGTSGLRFCP